MAKKNIGWPPWEMLGFDWLMLLNSSPLKLQIQMIFNLVQMMYVSSSTQSFSFHFDQTKIMIHYLILFQ